MKETCPGQPYIIFSAKPGIYVDFVNPVPFSGHFSYSIKISNDDTYKKVINRLLKHIKTSSGMKFSK